MYKYLNYTFTLAIAAFVIYSIVVTHRPLPRVQQVQFNQWHDEMMQDFKSMPLEKVPDVEISLKAPSGELGFNWSLSTNSKDEERVDQVERLLEFIRGAEMFGTEDSDEESQLTLTVQGAKKRFQTKISLEQIKSDIRLQNFITLFQVFSPNESEKQQKGLS